MININDLWIGDEVLLIKSQRRGKFIGTKKGKARIQVGKKVVVASGKNLERFKEQKHSKITELENEMYRDTPNWFEEKKAFPLVIDLHIEILQKEKANDPPAAIVEFQLRKLKEYLKNCITYRIQKATIIHGRGEGVLIYELNHMIGNYPQIVSKYPTNNGGATILYFKY